MRSVSAGEERGNSHRAEAPSTTWRPPPPDDGSALPLGEESGTRWPTSGLPRINDAHGNFRPMLAGVAGRPGRTPAIDHPRCEDRRHHHRPFGGQRLIESPSSQRTFDRPARLRSARACCDRLGGSKRQQAPTRARRFDLGSLISICLTPMGPYSERKRAPPRPLIPRTSSLAGWLGVLTSAARAAPA